ncbi:hypothetical protein JOD03_000677 [Chryseomicrobium aureum]|uniref:CPCC family cysteine-rich protein n=1 Tax=Chryseomicrobium aureum TaxID=1441723 RepID=UPI00195CC681|nr:CPCC family cysteine-rich protein [Chryseomicrobium aureum]MBM7705776.1 hypothetical protein [Chryseomicrobium aureum]
MITLLHTCPCCGYKTLEEPPGNFEICPICYWEDDTLQREDPFYTGGANEESLYEAQQNFLKFGASCEKYIASVRKPNFNDSKDMSFRLIEKDNT